MPKGSYTTSLFQKARQKLPRKWGRRGGGNHHRRHENDDENFIYEAADLIYHLIVLLSHKGIQSGGCAGELKKGTDKPDYHQNTALQHSCKA